LVISLESQILLTFYARLFVTAWKGGKQKLIKRKILGQGSVGIRPDVFSFAESPATSASIR